ncbi:hypothetical protein [Shewanella glacialipiscicola]|uniref:hypothetical protein n=1 Tax=Shewanella glacialipiscicola TaxID=614069 RepID=UPI003D7C01D9
MSMPKVYQCHMVLGQMRPKLALALLQSSPLPSTVTIRHCAEYDLPAQCTMVVA